MGKGNRTRAINTPVLSGFDIVKYTSLLDKGALSIKKYAQFELGVEVESLSIIEYANPVGLNGDKKIFVNVLYLNSEWKDYYNSELYDFLKEEHNTPLLTISVPCIIQPDYIKNYLDCSISRILIEEDKFEDRLDFFVSNIRNNYYSNLYNTSNVFEYQELMLRLFYNSYINPPKSQDGRKLDGHKFVRPFVFHSENFFSGRIKRIDEIRQCNSKDIVCINPVSHIEMRILLIDDKAYVPEGTDKKETHSYFLSGAVESAMTKFHVIIERLKSLFESLNYTLDDKLIRSIVGGANEIEVRIPEWGKLIFLFATDIQKAKDILYRKDKKVDLIMLDYLLSVEDNIEGSERWGTEFLKEINSNTNLQPGPLGYFWILPITAFNHAFLEDLRNKGLPYFNSKWFMSDGADPINTPELFKYKFIELLNQMIYRSGKFNNDGYFDNSLIGFIYSLVQAEIDTNADDKLVALKKNFGKNFHKITELYGDFQKLNEQKDHSLFNKSIIREKFYNMPLNTFAHLVNLFYLVGFGSRMQTGQMWEELNVFCNEIGGLLSPENIDLKKFESICREYISKKAND